MESRDNLNLEIFLVFLVCIAMLLCGSLFSVHVLDKSCIQRVPAVYEVKEVRMNSDFTQYIATNQKDDVIVILKIQGDHQE